MDRANIVKLAKIFDKFIELESSFVLVEDIRAIRKVEPSNVTYTGIEVITPYGTFRDSTDFDSFKVRIGDVMEALKEEKNKAEVNVLPPKSSKTVSTNSATEEEPKSGKVEKKNNSKVESSPLIAKRVSINLASGTSGVLFDDPSFKVVNREQIVVLSPDGVELAKGNPGGTIVGENISGIILESGKYTFAAKEYPGNTIVVNFQMRKRNGQ